MTQKQHDKHVADAFAVCKLVEGSSLDEAPSSPDLLGAWEGGREALKGVNTWVTQKSHTSRTADSKNAPGIDYASKITHRQDDDFNEIHNGADGEFFLYNHKTDAWDIKGDAADIPYYHNGTEWLGYNYKTGAWDVPVTIEYEGDEPLTDQGDTIATAIA